MRENKRPICECHEELLLHKKRIEHDYYTITLDGNRISKKYHDNDLIDTFVLDCTLICEYCGKEYELLRENNTFKRGKEILDKNIYL